MHNKSNQGWPLNILLEKTLQQTNCFSPARNAATIARPSSCAACPALGPQPQAPSTGFQP